MAFPYLPALFGSWWGRSFEQMKTSKPILLCPGPVIDCKGEHAFFPDINHILEVSIWSQSKPMVR